MSEQKKFTSVLDSYKQQQKEALDTTAKWVRSFCETRISTEKFIAGLENAIEMVDEEQSATIQTLDETDRKVAYLVGMATAYRKLKRAALRALEPDAVQPTAERPNPEPAEGGAD